MTHGSVFSGRGGFELGAMSAGIETKWFCEIDEWLRSKLKRISPHAKHYIDARTLKNPPSVDILSAGFPCQDISIANQRGGCGIAGIRSGLWKEIYRLADVIKPRYLILENSPELRRKGLEIVLADLSEIGYDAEWDCLCGYQFGFPQKRERIYIVAYPGGHGCRGVLLQPPGAFELSRRWAPTAAYVSVSSRRANGFRDIRAIQRGDVVHNFGREIHAFGNAVMPVVAEHLFLCVKQHFENNPTQ
jgi:DNA (cytosine-5)-methyltransferase 1